MPPQQQKSEEVPRPPENLQPSMLPTVSEPLGPPKSHKKVLAGIAAVILLIFALIIFLVLHAKH